MRYLIKIKYDGSKFYGFQKLNDHNTIQKEIEDALKSFTREDVMIKGAGRTDRGVHAVCQCVSFELEKALPTHKIRHEINRKTSKYIYVISCEEVDDDFHARFCVKDKTYLYKINMGEYDPLLADYVYQQYEKIYYRRIKAASKLFVGVHDFTNFVSGQRKSCEAIIYGIKVKKSKNIISIYFKGQSFYTYMVRNMVGAMIDYSNGKTTLSTIKSMLDYPTIKAQLCTAPAEGLYLININY